MRAYWRRIKRSLKGCRPSFSLGLLSFEEGFTLDVFGLMLALPYFFNRWHKEPEEIMDRWGFYYFPDGSDFVVEWGRFHKRFAMPWSMKHICHEVLTPSGKWVPEKTDYSKPDDIYGGHQWRVDGRWVGYYVYRYRLASGELQVRTATVHVERREWRQRWLSWTKRFAKVRTSIDVAFSGEVGERTGSWKGGCIGCGYDIKPGESAEQALRRMESERVFR